MNFIILSIFFIISTHAFTQGMSIKVSGFSDLRMEGDSYKIRVISKVPLLSKNLENYGGSLLSSKNQSFEYLFKQTFGFEKNIAKGPPLKPSEASKYLEFSEKLNFNSENFAEIAKVFPEKDLTTFHKSFSAYYKDLKNEENSKINPPTQVTEIFKTKRTACLDLAALYVAKVRSLGIPARIIIGAVIPLGAPDENLAKLHAWVEVFDQNRWFPIEPLASDLGLGDNGEFYIPLFEDFYYQNVPEPSTLTALVSQLLIQKQM